MHEDRWDEGSTGFVPRSPVEGRGGSTASRFGPSGGSLGNFDISAYFHNSKVKGFSRLFGVGTKYDSDMKYAKH